MEEPTINVFWSSHFHERLMDRFGIALTDTYKKKINDSFLNKEIFCNIVNSKGTAQVYKIDLDGQEVMVLFCKKTAISAYRRNWFSKNEQGWEVTWKTVRNSLKESKRRGYRGSSNKRKKVYKLNLKKLLNSDCESCLV